jgi:hypothetical protein
MIEYILIIFIEGFGATSVDGFKRLEDCQQARTQAIATLRPSIGVIVGHHAVCIPRPTGKK